MGQGRNAHRQTLMRFGGRNGDPCPLLIKPGQYRSAIPETDGNGSGIDFLSHKIEEKARVKERRSCKGKPVPLRVKEACRIPGECHARGEQQCKATNDTSGQKLTTP